MFNNTTHSNTTSTDTNIDVNIDVIINTSTNRNSLKLSKSLSPKGFNSKIKEEQIYNNLKNSNSNLKSISTSNIYLTQLSIYLSIYLLSNINLN
jgi:hypothetical protein